MKPVSSIYLARHFRLGERIAARLDRGCGRSVSRPLVFFRADDIGVPSTNFTQLIECFQTHKLPLCLATVPTWLTVKRVDELHRLTGKNNEQWYWHQHGRLHRNFEQTGKKQEFGPARPRQEIYASLSQGQKRLKQLLDTDFHPVFTPPWNRCSGDTLQALTELGFRAVSRSRGARPTPPAHLPDYQVNVDLHTRKESDPRLSVDNFLTELEQGLASGLCGIMIHHQRMNRAAFELLDLLLGLIQKNRVLTAVHFGDLL